MTLILIRNANLYAPQPLGIRHVLIGGDGEDSFLGLSGSDTASYRTSRTG